MESAGIIEAAYGLWPSPLTSDQIASGSIAFQELCTDDEKVYWTETRPNEKGRVALVSTASTDLFSDYSIRTRVHEYGGGALLVAGGVVYFCNNKDQQLYSGKPGQAPVQITHAERCRFADFVIHPNHQFLIAVCEEHNEGVENYLAKIDLKSGTLEKMAWGHDFFSSPGISPDGKRLVWVAWDHPNLPWDDTTLWMAKLEKDGTLSDVQQIAGGENESVCQPEWSATGELYFISDRSGYWNIYCWRGGKEECVHSMEADCALPGWLFRRSSYAITDNHGVIACIYSDKGIDRLALIDPHHNRFQKVDVPFTAMRNLALSGRTLYFFGASPTLPQSLIAFDLSTGQWNIVKQSMPLSIASDYISTAEQIAFPSTYGESYAFFYPPKNPKVRAKAGEKPPLIVKVHGGPTSHVQTGLNLEAQFWTTRGFAFMEVNYSGSSGYGRAYRKRLEGKWGLADVEDCVHAAQFLAKQGRVDPKRLFIKGGSAGGYTVLASLAFHQVFAGGTSYYGVSDLELLLKDTHKFEARYLDRLIGPYPEKKALYKERSPIHHVDQIRAPVLLLQGKDDPVVPPNQAEEIFAALKKKGMSVEMIIFEGEQHGFRMASTIKRCLDAELSFYLKLV